MKWYPNYYFYNLIDTLIKQKDSYNLINILIKRKDSNVHVLYIDN